LNVVLPSRAVACAGIAALGLLISSNGLQTLVANGDTRSISLTHTHRDDQITVTFKRNGRYDDEGLKKLNYFLRDWRNDEQTRMDPQLFDILWEVSREVGTKESIHIVSSYRSPATNSMLRRRSRGVAKFSQHMLGKAIDFKIPGVAVEDLRVAGLRLQRGGVGFYPGSFVHMDVGSVRHWPRMTHDQLARVFPDGRTVHVPSNGQPLARYAQALADIEKRGSSGMSLAAARNTGAADDEERPQRVASAGGKPKKGILSRLFGFSTDTEEEDDDTPSAARAKGDTKVAAAAPAKPEPKLERIPLPQARPAAIAQANIAGGKTVPAPGQGGGFALASATSTPFTLPSRTVPRPPADITGSTEVSAARENNNDSLTNWLKDAEFARTNDRVSPDVALAYAAQATPDDPRRQSALTAPMGSVRANPAATTQVARIPPKAGQRFNDPWLRVVTLATSVHSDMNVSVYGKLDVRQVRMMMIKPQASLPMNFAVAEPYDGMQTARFAGAAVTFLPTVPFGTQQQAALR